jgi:hypothetical protein
MPGCRKRFKKSPARSCLRLCMIPQSATLPCTKIHSQQGGRWHLEVTEMAGRKYYSGRVTGLYSQNAATGTL